MKTPLYATLLICLLALVSPAFAGTGPTPALDSTSGYIVTVNKKAVTIKIGEKEKTFTVGKNTKVKLDGVASTLSSLAAGQHASILTKVNKTTKVKSTEAQEIDAHTVSSPDATPSPTP